MTGTIQAAIIGGSVAKIGGGKFANGAATAAMVHMFNTLAHQEEGIDAGDSDEATDAEDYVLTEEQAAGALDFFYPHDKNLPEPGDLDLKGRQRATDMVKTAGEIDQVTDLMEVLNPGTLTKPSILGRIKRALPWGEQYDVSIAQGYKGHLESTLGFAARNGTARDYRYQYDEWRLGL